MGPAAGPLDRDDFESRAGARPTLASGAALSLDLNLVVAELPSDLTPSAGTRGIDVTGAATNNRRAAHALDTSEGVHPDRPEKGRCIRPT